MINSKHLLILSLFTAAAALAACAPADGGSSSAGLPKGRIDAGELQAQVKGEATGQSCIDCHGPDGNQPLDPTYPKLGGQYEDYLGHALQQYRSGARDHSLMSNQAQGLSDQQIADLAAFFASQPSELRDLSGVY
ncbi:c-type cytochrome [Luteimonas sp. JM171]|uniref:c-type cytochrome n=1 Tax=Luteimonas sp. JM171 TaxID=1896164 RepID=UPI000858FECD|nr:cytochrome c [Luteimonas sp. JM171]AOH36916.1 cytochrome C biogenesis protein CcsA [Luteimonas sp. JM171]